MTIVITTLLIMVAASTALNIVLYRALSVAIKEREQWLIPIVPIKFEHVRRTNREKL